MPRSIRQGAATTFIATLAFFTVAAASPLARAEESIQVVDTSGAGDLTMCRSWFVFDTCEDYHHVKIPAQIKVGDTLRLRFGSNLKDYRFPVERILLEGGNCLLLAEKTGPTEHVNRISATPCKSSAH